MTLCSSPGCGSRAKGRGYCGKHHIEALRTGRLDRLQAKRGTNPIHCQKPGCKLPTHARGFCKSCYMTARAKGELPKLIHKPQPKTEMQRWAALVELPKHPNGCWRWKGYHTRAGYAGFRWNGASNFAHIYGYVRFFGEVPEGKELDHLCRRRWCVNPAHLEPVTMYENTVVRAPTSPAGLNLIKTHCKYGHPFDEENTRWRVNPKNGRRHRKCRACARGDAPADLVLPSHRVEP